MVTERSLDVYLDGRLVGALTQSLGGNVSFTYSADYQASEAPTPLSLSMPLAARRHPKRVVVPWLQGLLPDNSDALAGIARRFRVSANNPFALLEHVGRDAAGAVQIVPSGDVATDAGSRELVTPMSDDQLSRILGEVVMEYTEGVPYPTVTGRFSLAGAQPKVALHRLEDGTWGVPEDATPTTHILKPVVGELRRLDVVEQLTMRAAAHLGIRVARTEIMTIGDWDVLVSERYDRRATPEGWRRLHQEDLCQALSVSPDKKYQHLHGGPGLGQVSALLRSLPVADDRQRAGHAFYRAFVFNVVAGCTDAHAKNYALMLSGQSVELAPLYDLLTYAGYWDGVSRLESAMSVDSEYALDRISHTSLVQVGRRFGVPDAESEEIVHSTRQGLVDAFLKARDELTVKVTSATSMADAVVSGVKQLPLVYGAV